MNRSRFTVAALLAAMLALSAATAFAETGGKAKGEGRGEGRRGGMHQGRGPGGPGGPPPMFGVVTEVSATSITVKPEVPEFIRQRMEERMAAGSGEGRRGPGGEGRGPGGEGRRGPEGRELPESVSVSLNAETIYVVNEQEQSTNPFRVGDRVAIRAAGQPGQFSAKAVSDYATAEARMAKMGEKMREHREKRQERRGQRRERRQ